MGNIRRSKTASSRQTKKVTTNTESTAAGVSDAGKANATEYNCGIYNGRLQKIRSHDRFEIWHGIPPPPSHRLAIVPFGLYYNRELQNAKFGDLLYFWENGIGKVIRVCKFDLNTQFATFIFRYVYDAAIETCKQRWRRNLEREGALWTAIFQDKALLIEYEVVQEPTE